ncbi:hypothetical protein I302_104014 [Kwoniella bestiolae CBS 10118]|uniref:Uncharacterized protein n=1 Tax=Kwoniella bestiolae CBS 10118 TaxID=1296100 RepID=A0A1B9GA12_9TREE|nr:hypothetical protein I302_02719 [Kwoniella bestiolae CBS 10118]OCF27869.1 hypothetical protein I302_02719 [Kwoniella bestiolae CBS 10118]
MPAITANNGSYRIPQFSNPRSAYDGLTWGHSVDVVWIDSDPSEQTLSDREHEFLDICSGGGAFGEALNADGNLKNHARKTFYWLSEVNHDITAERLRNGNMLEFYIDDYSSSLEASPSPTGRCTLTIYADPSHGDVNGYLSRLPLNSADYRWYITDMKRDSTQGTLKFGYGSLGPREVTDPRECLMAYSLLMDVLRSGYPSMDANFSKVDAALKYCLPPYASDRPEPEVDLEIALEQGFLGSISAPGEEDHMPQNTQWVVTL